MTILFNDAYRLNTIGFDEAINRLNKLSKNTKQHIGYPPYNIVKINDNQYTLELAVAGFSKQEIEIELKDTTLVVSGKLKTDDNTEYLFKGIADRAFTRTFTLADTIQVKNAQLLNGMLKIWLENVIPDHKKPRKIDIEEENAKYKNLD